MADSADGADGAAVLPAGLVDVVALLLWKAASASAAVAAVVLLLLCTRVLVLGFCDATDEAAAAAGLWFGVVAAVVGASCRQLASLFWNTCRS